MTAVDEAGLAAREAALRGDFRPAAEILASTDANLAGWRACLEIMRAGAGLMARGVSLESLAQVPSQARLGANHALFELARDAVAHVDPAALEPCAAALEQAPESDPLAARWARLWHRALTEPDAPIAEEAQQAGREALARGAAELVVELAALRAFVLLGQGELEEATRAARRASRMGRTEAMPQQEYLANLVLARLRRSAGQPHLATRILTALALVAPARWQGWLAWELALAGSSETARTARAEAHDGALLAGVDELLGGPRAPTLPAPFDRELVAVRSACELEHDPGAIADWLFGATDQTPAALHGLALLPDGHGDPRPRVCVVPGSPPRRLLALGAARDDQRIDPSVPPHPRTETMLAVVAQAGAIERDELYRRVYGFTFDPAVHQGSFDVLLHRARAWLGERATIERDGRGDFQMNAHAAFAIPDPRCERPIDDRLLQLVAERGGVGAKEAASELGVPLRTIQTLLKQLVEDGACEQRREGRRIVYQVEDTTFREPTTI